MKKLIVFISAAIILISCQTNYKKSLEIDQIFENYYQESLELYPLNATSPVSYTHLTLPTTPYV